MTIHIARRRSQDWRISLNVFLDDEQVAHLAPGMSVDVQGTGKPQLLQVRGRGTSESLPLTITDPGAAVIGVVVSYQPYRGWFSRTKRALMAEVNWDNGPVRRD